MTADSISDGSIVNVDGSISTNTGIAFWCSTAAAVDQYVNAGQITSSPGPTPAAASAMWIADVPLLVTSAYFAPQYSAHSS